MLKKKAKRYAIYPGVCTVCGSDFMMESEHVKRGRKFCSRECAYKGRVGVPKFKNGHKPYGRSLPGHKTSEETKRKIRIANSGKKLSEESRKKMSKARSGEKNPMFGRRGHLNPQWLGGKTFEEYSVDWRETLKRSIRERDHYLCRICNAQQGDKAHAIHHIDYDKKNCDPMNLITLCNSCHSKTNFNRDKWIDYFNKL